MTAFDVVVAADEAGGIGRDGRLPWRLPGDMAYFKRLTIATSGEGQRNAVIMGRKTWESIPDRFRPLQRRFNVVISRNPTLELPAGVALASGFDAALERADAEPDVASTFVIGGGQIYAEALEHEACRTLYLTRVAGEFGCDTRLPPLGDRFERVAASEEHANGDVRYRFERWQRCSDDSNDRSHD